MSGKPESSGDGAKSYGTFVLRGSSGTVNISKELFDGIGCIVFDNGVCEDSEVSGDWSNELLEKYVELCKLRRAMNFFFFVDGVMKDDVREVSEVWREELDFIQLFELSETLHDDGMAYYASYFIDIQISTPVGEYTMPLIYLRHHDGIYYSDFIGNMLDDLNERFIEPLYLINVGKFDMIVYKDFCKLRMKNNGKLYTDTKNLKKDVYETLNKYSDEVLGTALEFANYIGDLTTEHDKVMVHEYHHYANVIGCVIGTQFRTSTEFSDINKYLTAINKPPTYLYKGGGAGGAGAREEGDEEMPAS